jgi:hypothetical protein
MGSGDQAIGCRNVANSGRKPEIVIRVVRRFVGRGTRVQRVRVRAGGGTSFAIAVVALGLLASCTSTSSGAAPPSSGSTASTPSSVTSFSPNPTQQAGDAALAAYRGFRQAQVRAEANADAAGSGLERYAFDKALDGVYSAILFFRQQGIVVRGQPVLNPTVTSVTLGTTPRVAIQDCFDTSKWETVYKATGKSAVAPGQARRSVVTATVETYRGQWMVRTVTNQRDRTC